MAGPEHAQSKPAGLAVMEMIGAPWIAQAIYVIAKLEIPDKIATGVNTVRALAAATQVSADALGRVLRALTVPGVLVDLGDGSYGLTPLSEMLQKSVPGSMHAMAVMFGEEFHWRPVGDMLHSVRTGESAYSHVFGEPAFSHWQKNPEWFRIFNAAMTDFSRAAAPVLVAGFPWGRFKRLVDVGGGHGSLLAAILEANPNLQGTVFDLPQVADGARAAVPSGLVKRMDAVGGDFLESVPAGGDAYMMKHIVHDWDDERCIRLFQNVRKVVPADGRLLVLEMVVPPPGQPHMSKLLDIEMLLMTEGGRERTEAEFAALFARGGFKLVKVHAMPASTAVIEAQPA